MGLLCLANSGRLWHISSPSNRYLRVLTLSSYRLASRVSRIKPSPTLTLTARANELKAAGRDVIALSAGEPDFDTPNPIKDAAIKAIADGHTRYTAVDGIPALKKAIIDKFSRENQLTYQMDEILVSAGAKHSIFNALIALIEENSDDEVIIPAPYWVSYPDMVMLAGGQPVIVPTTTETAYKMTAAQLEAAITPKTRLLMLNTPSNPTGMAYSRSELEQLGAVLKKHPHVLVLSDDIYEHILWSKEGFLNLPMVCPDLKDQTIVINGVSKSYAMTGWRIGYTAGPAPIIKAMKKIQGQSTSNPCSIAQHAALAALSQPLSLIAPMKQAFHERHDYLVKALNNLPGVDCLPADGTFYLFADFSEAISKKGSEDDNAFAEWCMTEGGVALVPGSAFGAPGFMRLSFATSMEQLQSAIARLEKLLG